MAPQVIAWKPLGELLVERGLVSVAEVNDALDEQARTGERLGKILVARRAVAGAVLTTLLAEQVGVELETQGGFGSGLFSKLATGTSSLEAEVKPNDSVEAAPADGGTESLTQAAAALADPAYELSALRAELEMLRAQNAQLEAEVATLKAKTPAPRRRTKPNSTAA